MGALRSEFLMRLSAEFEEPVVLGDTPGGADWVLMRRDGIAPPVRARFQAGEEVDPSEYYFRTALFFETGAEKYLWLNRLLAVRVARRTATGMVTDIHTIR